MKLKAVFICFAATVMAAPAYAQTGTITGTVTDAVSATPILSPASIQLYRADGTQGGSVSTNASGQYTFTGLTPGVYFVKTGTAIPYYNKLYDDIPCLADDCRITAGTPVTVTAGGTAVADFAMHHGRVFSGTVRRAATNAPVTTGFVQVFNAAGSFVTSASTGLDGSYVVTGLIPGIYYARATFQPTVQPQALAELYGGLLCADFPDRNDLAFFRRVDPSCRVVSGAPISTESPNPIGIDFLLDPPATIAGRVVADDGGSPIGGINVALFSGDVEVARTNTIAGGLYLISGVYPGTYRVRTIGTGPYVDEWLGNVCVGCSGAPQALTVGVGTNIIGIDFSLATGGAISGFISCPNSTFVRGPGISAFSASGELVRVLETFCPTPPAPALYRLEGLSPGLYYLLARDPLVTPFGTQPWGGSLVDNLYGGVVCNTVDCDARRGVPVAVTQGDTTGGIDFVMPRGADSSPVLSRLSPLRMFDSRGVEMVGVVRSNISPPPGGWDVVGLPAGTYFAKYGNRLHGGIVCADCPPTSGTPIVIKPGDQTFTLNFGSQAPGHTVSGTITDGPAPLSTITVELLTDGAQLLATGPTDQFGRYSIPDVPPGTYFLRTRNDRGYADEVYQDIACASCDARAGAPVVVGASDVAGIDFSLAAGGVISGGVRDAPVNTVVAGVPISIFSATGSLAGQAVSGLAGTFRVNLPAGSYRARAEATASHGAELFSEMPCTSAACDVTAGTPIAVATGNVTPNVNFTLASCSAMTLSPQLLATGVVGLPYRQVMTVSGGTSPNHFRVTTGGLPDGIALGGSTGVLSGTPTLSGRYEFSVGAVDASSCATARTFTLDVQECAFMLSPAGATVPAAGGAVTINIIGACGSQTVTNATGFVHEQSNTPGQVVLSVDANTGAASRVQHVTIGRRVFSIRQGGVSSVPPFGALDIAARWFAGQRVAAARRLGAR